ncbi:putative MATE family efflux protein [Methanomicrobium sp. W14]|uniref:MATE family efflux transporter n=1 Tax=Methanomicrobium sp. W14 TaxID=2817839 RepID=UPI001AE8E599|nr:MATE family efflux transporter [Methanomicrobium sp. W14]MBP2133382.1 putative MATE family efflux protein [Methanomicrobium sp. W14]
MTDSNSGINNTETDSNSLNDNVRGATKRVSILTGDPKKAIIKLSGPMIVAMLLFSVYNLVDAIWVAGISPDALAAVGFIMPVFMILTGLGNGIGAGVTSAISRFIGAESKSEADNGAVHSFILAIILSIVLTIPFVFFIEPIVAAMQAGTATGLAAIYGQIVFSGTILFFFSSIGYAVLRAEGDTKRTMYAMTISAVLNMVLDPVMIYWMNMGIAGAAWATLISIAMVNLILLYWFFVKKDTYVSVKWKAFNYKWSILKDILGVGIPASLEFMLMAIVLLLVNFILVDVSGTDAVAVYTGGWRVVMFAVIPVISIGMAVVSVVGANYGAGNYENIKLALNYSLKIGVIIGICTSAFTWYFAPQITAVFTYSSESAYLVPSFIAFLQTMFIFYPFVAPGIMSSSVFQGTGHGVTSFVINLFRNLVFIALFAYILGEVVGLGEHGVWYGIVLGDICGGILAYTWASLYLRVLLKHEKETRAVST